MWSLGIIMFEAARRHTYLSVWFLDHFGMHQTIVPDDAVFCGVGVDSPAPPHGAQLMLVLISAAAMRC